MKKAKFGELNHVHHCKCGGILDFVYHVLWRCRACSAWRSVAPPPTDIIIRHERPIVEQMRRRWLS